MPPQSESEDKMELTVLGKYGPYPKAGHGAASGYLLTQGDTALVMDMGSGTLARLQQAIDIRKITGIFISHLHYDHTSDLLPLRYLLEEIEHTVTVYTAYSDSEWYKILFSPPNIKVINISSESRVKIGEFSLEFFDMKHSAPCLAARIEGEKTLVFTGDTMYNENIEKACEGADILLADCSKPEGFPGPHMNVSHAKAFSDRLGIKIISTHLSPDYDPSEEYKDYPDITVAEEMKTYAL